MNENLAEVGVTYVVPEPPPEPTTEQLARRKALRGFNRRTIFLPMAIIAFIWLVIVAAMIWLAVVGEWFGATTDSESFRLLLSGVADAVLIVLFSFWFLLGMIPIGVTGYVWLQLRERRKRRPPGPDPLPIMWRIENVVVMISDRVMAFLPYLARPIVLLYGVASYIRALFLEVWKIITRSK